MGANHQAIEPQVLSTEEAAEYLNRPVSFVRKVIRYECPVVQHADRKPCFYYKHDLDLWLLRNTQQPVR